MFARHVAARADTLVTPINDSFIDFDLIGQVDPESFQVVRPSFYSELIWDTRKTRAKADGRTIDWIVLRNRLQHVDAHNMRRVGEALNQLSRRVGFRVIPGLGERVIYRELFPRSEEHTSELQSLMRNSYAVFCLTKKTINKTIK